jgi:hypothetical protein
MNEFAALRIGASSPSVDVCHQTLMYRCILFRDFIRTRRPDCSAASGPEVTGAGLDFSHRQLDLAGLQMTDIDLGSDRQLLQLIRQHLRTQVLGDFGKPLFAIREGGFDQQIAQIGNAIDHRPESIIDRRVAGKTRLPAPSRADSPPLEPCARQEAP